MNRSRTARGMNLCVFMSFLSILGLMSGLNRPLFSDEGEGWDMTRLDLDVTVYPGQKRVDVNGVMYVKLSQERSMGPSILINSRSPNMTFSRVQVAGSDSILINQKLPMRKAVRKADIRFNEPLMRGAELEIVFEYSSDGESGQFGVNDQACIASWVDSWHPFPLFDPMSGKSLSTVSKSVGTMTLRIPKHWRGVTEGKLLERTTSETGSVEVWECVTPLARSFAAGKFSVATQQAGERTISVYRLSEAGVSASRLADTISNVLVSLESRFGPYPYQSYSIVETPVELGNFGAASLQGIILAKPKWFEFAGGSLPLFSHEMAHGWWGNLVGTDGPGSILCSESLAQYSAAIAIESILGQEEATEFMRFSREDYISIQCARGYFEIWRSGHDMPMSRLGSGGWFHNLSDSKGHWIYHMLRRRVGDELFFGTLRELIAVHADSKMSLDDVRQAFHKAAPDAGLKQFFDQWLDQIGAPILKIDWVRSNAQTITVTVEQQQEGKPYHLDLDLGLHFENKEVRTTQVRLDRQKQSFQIASRNSPVEIELDPDHRLLIWTSEYGENPLVVASSPTKKLTAKQASMYEGDYDVQGLGTIQFINDGGVLTSLVSATKETSPVVYLGEHRFKTAGFTVTFTVEDGHAISFEAKRGGKTRIGKRKNLPCP